jgi:hypothetical protein
MAVATSAVSILEVAAIAALDNTGRHLLAKPAVMRCQAATPSPAAEHKLVFYPPPPLHSCLPKYILQLSQAISHCYQTALP